MSGKKNNQVSIHSFLHEGYCGSGDHGNRRCIDLRVYVSVIQHERQFSPTVTWINEDPITHHVVHLPEATHPQLFDSGPLSSGQSFSFRFMEKGRYSYADPQIGGGRSSLVIVE
jgi:hypothetical protein